MSTTAHHNGSAAEEAKKASAPRVADLRTVSWSESLDESELDVPGTPRGPRTTTTPGTIPSTTLQKSRLLPFPTKIFNNFFYKYRKLHTAILK